MSVFMGDAAEAIVPSYVEVGDLARIGDRCGQRVEWPGLRDALVGPMSVVELLELPEYMEEVALVPIATAATSLSCPTHSVPEGCLYCRTVVDLGLCDRPSMGTITDRRHATSACAGRAAALLRVGCQVWRGGCRQSAASLARDGRSGRVVGQRTSSRPLGRAVEPGSDLSARNAFASRQCGAARPGRGAGKLAPGAVPPHRAAPPTFLVGPAAGRRRRHGSPRFFADPNDPVRLELPVHARRGIGAWGTDRPGRRRVVGSRPPLGLRVETDRFTVTETDRFPPWGEIENYAD